MKGRVAGVGDSGVYNGRNLSDGYRAVYHLLPHFDSCLPEDQLQYCIVGFGVTVIKYVFANRL